MDLFCRTRDGRDYEEEGNGDAGVSNWREHKLLQKNRNQRGRMGNNNLGEWRQKQGRDNAELGLGYDEGFALNEWNGFSRQRKYDHRDRSSRYDDHNSN